MRETRKLRKKSHKKTRSFRKMKGRGELDDIPFSTNEFSFIGQNNENKRKKTEDIKEYNKNYYQENKDKIRKYQKGYNKNYYQENKDKKKEYQKGYNEENKDKKKEYNKNYYQENKDERKVKDKEYYEQNKDKKKEKRQLLRLKKKRMQEEKDVANILLGLSNNNLVSNTNKSQGIKDISESNIGGSRGGGEGESEGNYDSESKTYDCQGCANFPENIPLETESLFLSDSTIKIIPDSIGKLTNLRTLDLSNCSDLRSISESIGNLTNLTELYLQDDENLIKIPESISKLTNLNEESIQQIKNLRRTVNIKSILKGKKRDFYSERDDYLTDMFGSIKMDNTNDDDNEIQNRKKLRTFKAGRRRMRKTIKKRRGKK